MANSNGAVAEQPKVIVNGETRTLPEEQFWQRHSPHFEFPLSHAAAWVVHIIAGVFLILIAVGWSLGWWADDNTPNMDTIAIAGGGGNPNGIPGGPGTDTATPLLPETPPDRPVDPNVTTPPPTLPQDIKVDAAKDPLVTLPSLTDDNGQRVVNQANAAIREMEKINSSARTKMFNGLADKGPGGPGPGGPGGPGPGGKNKLSERQERLLRWAIQFQTLDGSDYVRQLDRLGAMIGIPEANGEYRLYRDLKTRPAKGEIENVADIKRIYWIDSRSVVGICEALRIPKPAGPEPHFIAFFPEELEKKLTQLEMAFLNKKYPGKTVKDVEETSFEVVSNEPHVRSMTLKADR